MSGGGRHHDRLHGRHSVRRSPQVRTPMASEGVSVLPPTLWLIGALLMSRVYRAVGTRRRLTDRDMELLQFLGTFRLASGAHVRRLHHPDAASPTHATAARKARGRLGRLLGMGVVFRLPRRIGGVEAGADGFTYGLTGLGQAVLDLGAGRGIKQRPRGAPVTKPAFADHLLAGVELYVSLVEFCRTDTDVELLDFQAEPTAWRWQVGTGGQPVALKPDGWVRLGIGEFERTVFLEHDLATESLPTITRKLHRYIAYWRSGQEQHDHGIFPQTWWLVPNTKRRDAIRATIRRLPPDSHQLFSVCLAEEAIQLLTQPPTEGGADARA